MSEKKSNKVEMLWREEDPYMYELLFLGSRFDIIRQLNVALPSFVAYRLKTSSKKFSMTFSKALKNKKLMKQLREEYRPLRNALSEKKDEDAMLAWSRQKYEPITNLWMCSSFVEIIREMSLVYLVAEFENFLGKVLRLTFDSKPEILSSSQKTMTFEELVKIKEISEVRSRLIEKEIQHILNLDIEQICAYFREKLGINLSSFVDWKKVTEMFYRRHIIVHNSGIASKLYAMKTGTSLEGKRLQITESYLKECHDLFFLTAFVITATLRSKVKTNPKEKKQEKSKEEKK